MIAVMAGLALFPQKNTRGGPGTKGLTLICLCFFVLNLCQMAQGIAKEMFQGRFNPRPKLHEKRFWAPSEVFVVPSSVQKPSHKHLSLTSIG